MPPTRDKKNCCVYAVYILVSSVSDVWTRCCVQWPLDWAWVSLTPVHTTRRRCVGPFRRLETAVLHVLQRPPRLLLNYWRDFPATSPRARSSQFFTVSVGLVGENWSPSVAQCTHASALLKEISTERMCAQPSAVSSSACMLNFTGLLALEAVIQLRLNQFAIRLLSSLT